MGNAPTLWNVPIRSAPRIENAPEEVIFRSFSLGEECSCSLERCHWECSEEAIFRILEGKERCYFECCLAVLRSGSFPVTSLVYETLNHEAKSPVRNECIASGENTTNPFGREALKVCGRRSHPH